MNVRCPHCRNAVEFVEDSTFEELDCPSCGTHFSLLGDETQVLQHFEPTSLGQFRLVEPLGRGHFGQVWKAVDTELERDVAVKIPRAAQFDEDDAAGFLREAQAAAQLKHPNIVTVFEVGREEGTFYIVSELIEGHDLSDQLTARLPAIREAAELCVKIADALHHAHEHGVIHRDLKPANVLIDLQGEPHVQERRLLRRGLPGRPNRGVRRRRPHRQTLGSSVRRVEGNLGGPHGGRPRRRIQSGRTNRCLSQR